MDAKMKNPIGEIRDIHFIYSVVKGYENSLERVIISTEDITNVKLLKVILIRNKELNL
jgi:hypothetical protein